MEKTLGSNHPNTKIVRENHARLLEDMKEKRRNDAENAERAAFLKNPLFV